jgi:hypothetical protein
VLHLGFSCSSSFLASILSNSLILDLHEGIVVQAS